MCVSRAAERLHTARHQGVLAYPSLARWIYPLAALWPRWVARIGVTRAAEPAPEGDGPGECGSSCASMGTLYHNTTDPGH